MKEYEIEDTYILVYKYDNKYYMLKEDAKEKKKYTSLGFFSEFCIIKDIIENIIETPTFFISPEAIELFFEILKIKSIYKKRK